MALLAPSFNTPHSRACCLAFWPAHLKPREFPRENVLLTITMLKGILRLKFQGNLKNIPSPYKTSDFKVFEQMKLNTLRSEYTDSMDFFGKPR